MPQLKPFELAENMFGLCRPGKPPEPRQRAKELFEHQPRRVASIYFFFFARGVIFSAARNSPADLPAGWLVRLASAWAPHRAACVNPACPAGHVFLGFE